MSASGFKPFGALAVVGLGLIGGSFARDVRRLGLARQIIGYDNNKAYLKEISSLNLVDYLAATPDEKLAEAELILLAVPVKAFAEVLTQIRPHLSTSAIITDSGSVKSPLLKIMSKVIVDAYQSNPPFFIARESNENAGSFLYFSSSFEDTSATLSLHSSSVILWVEKLEIVNILFEIAVTKI